MIWEKLRRSGNFLVVEDDYSSFQMNMLNKVEEDRCF